MDHIYAAIIVEEKRMIVQRGPERSLRPVSRLDIFGFIYMRLARRAGKSCNVERAVVIAQAARPRAGSVSVPPVLQRESVIVSERFIGIADDLPVHRILRLHDRKPRTHV